MLSMLHTIGSFNNLLMPMKKSNILIKFGENVREKRKEKGLSQEQLSFKADLHRTYIGMIERAEKNITLSNIEKIAKALEVEIIELLK
jgi:transcriptional regulator with XRE-family HTH domain